MTGSTAPRRALGAPYGPPDHVPGLPGPPGASQGPTGLLLSLTEATARLDPPLARRTLGALVRTAGLTPAGYRAHRGPPIPLYPSDALDRLHADWVNGRITSRGRRRG